MVKKGHSISISIDLIKKQLLNEWTLTDEQRRNLKSLFVMFEAIWHHDSHNILKTMKEKYEMLNPDTIIDNKYPHDAVENFLELIDESLGDGNWEPISDQEFQDSLEGEDVLPISLNVRLNELAKLKMYKLGELHDEIEIKSFFGLIKKTKRIELFSRVLTIIEFHDYKWFNESRKRMVHYPGNEANGLHIRLFRDVPKLDLEVIFPNTSPNMRTIEKIKIFAPLIGGGVTIIMKYGPLLIGAGVGSTGVSLLGGVLTGVGTYVMKTYMAFQKTKEKFRGQVAKDMYFKGMANNECVLTYINDLAEEQEVKEAIIAYVFILFEMEQKFTESSLDERIEKWLYDKFQVEIDFEVDDALVKLENMKLLSTFGAGELNVLSLTESLIRLDQYWDAIYDFE